MNPSMQAYRLSVRFMLNNTGCLYSFLVMHIALRAPATTRLLVDGADVVPDVHRVLDAIEEFSADIRAGRRVGATGKRLTTVISIGIGGSYLGELCL